VLDDWEVDEFDVASGLVRRKFGKYDMKDETVKRKVYAFLAHRGYQYELIENVLRNIQDTELKNEI
jgi:regulatory protein